MTIALSAWALCSFQSPKSIPKVMASEAKTNGTKSVPDPSAAVNEAPKRLEIKSDIPYYVRCVRTDDVDEIARVAVKTFEVSPLWLYCAPYSKQYPEDHYHFTREQYKGYIVGALSKPAKNHFVVVETPTDQSDSLDSDNTSSDSTQHGQTATRKMKIVAFAIWQHPYTYACKYTSYLQTYNHCEF